MDSHYNLLISCFIIILSSTLIACGEDSDDAGTGNGTENIPLRLSGVAAKGLIANAVVDIYTQDGQTLLSGGSITNNNGEFTAELPGNTLFPVLIQSSGGSYSDEYTRNVVQLDAGDALYAYAPSNVNAAITPFTSAMKLSVDKMLNEGYEDDITTAIQRARIHYGQILSVDPAILFAASLIPFGSQQTGDHAIALGGFSKLLDDLNTLHAGAVSQFDIIQDMIHDLANDGALDGEGALNNLTAALAGGNADLAAAASAYLLSQYPPGTTIDQITEEVRISSVDFNQTLYIVADIQGTGGSLIFTGPDANLVHGGALYEPSAVSMYLSEGIPQFSINNGEYQEDPDATPIPYHSIIINSRQENGETLTDVDITDSAGYQSNPPDYDLYGFWTSSYCVDTYTCVNDVPGLSFDYVNQRIVFSNVNLYRITNASTEPLYNPPVSVIVNGELTY